MRHGTWGRGAVTRQAQRAPLIARRWARRDAVARQRPSGLGARDDGRLWRRRAPGRAAGVTPSFAGLVDCLGAAGGALDDAFWSAYVEVE